MPITGRDLRVERAKINAKVKEVALEMGVSRATVWHLERMDLVPAERGEQYLAACKRLQDVKTGTAA